MNMTTLLVIGGGLLAYHLHKKKKAEAVATAAAAVTKQPTNPEAGDVTVVPLLAEPQGAVTHYDEVPSAWGPNWGSYRNSGIAVRRRRRR